MDILQSVLGGSNRQEMTDFVDRYQQGAPWEGISNQEAYDRYGQVATQLPPDQYRESARDAFARMSPQERGEFARMLQNQAQQRSVNIPDLNGDGIDDRAQQDPGYLAGVTTQMHQQQPDMLQQLLGGGGGGGGGAGSLLSNPLAKAALAGITAMAAQRIMGGQR